VEKDNHYFIYTHGEDGLEREFEITNIDNFLATQENIPQLIKEMELKVAFQRDLKTGIEDGVISCNDEGSSEDTSESEIEYLELAVFNNMRTIKKAREYLGWSPEPKIRDSIFKTEFLKSKREMN
jgi:hypothetical protein